MNIFRRMLKMSIQRRWKYVKGGEKLNTIFMEDLRGEKRKDKKDDEPKGLYISDRDVY